MKKEELSYEEKYEQSIRLLNLKAKNYYRNESDVVSIQNKNRFKAAFLTGIIDFERTVRGAFGSALDFKNINIPKMRLMFPYAFVNIFDLRHKYEQVGMILESIRNINAHVYLSKEDEEVFNYDYSSLENAPKIDNRIKYLDEGEITLAGLIFILLNLLREESIAAITKKEGLFNVVAEGRLCTGDGKRFVEEISHVNLEIDIREDKPTNIVDSVLGDYVVHSVFKDGQVSLIHGDSSNPVVKIDSAIITDNEIVVRKGSLTKAFYKEDYTLKIDSPELFIELSNKLPPFALVDYCYLINMHVFNKEAYDKFKNHYLLYKLNKPKYYVDKNVKVLLLTKYESDYRVISSVVCDGLLSLFLSLEEYFYTKHVCRNDGSYSTLRTALEKTGLSFTVRERVIALRNLVAHGYMFGDYAFFKSELYEVDIEFVKDTLYKLAEGLKKVDSDAYELLAARTTGLIIRRTLDTKYRKIDEASFAYLKNDLKGDIADLKKRYSLIAHSSFDSNVLANLSKICHSHHRIFEVYFPELDFPLCLIANRTVLDTLHNVIKEKGYSYQKTDGAIVIQYKLTKN